MRLSWLEVEKYTELLAQKIKQSGFSPDIIVAVGVSGLIPAALIAKKLERNKLRLITISSYNNQVKNKPQVISTNLVGITGKKILCVDDIVATGETFKCLASLLADRTPKIVKYAAPVVSKRVCKNYPDYFGVSLMRAKDDFIEFPWD